MPTTIAPFSFAILATTGIAPVPVPPPIPAAMNTRLQSFVRSSMSLLDISALFSPISGKPPAPRPWVSCPPSMSLVMELLSMPSCLRSVLNAKRLAPFMSRLLSLWTVLFPAPPTPTTAIFGLKNSKSSCLGFCFDWSYWSNMGSRISVESKAKKTFLAI